MSEIKFISFTPQDLDKFDNIELEEILDTGDDCLRTYLMSDEEKLEALSCGCEIIYSLYGHLIEGHVEHISDHPDYKSALEFATWLKHQLPNYDPKTY